MIDGLEHGWIIVPIILGIWNIPTDFHSIIFQRGWWLNHQPDNIINHH